MPMSGQNELFLQARPPTPRRWRCRRARGAGGGDSIATCTTVGRLDNGVGVPNEEQGQPIAVCRDVRQPWDVVWPPFRHLD